MSTIAICTSKPASKSLLLKLSRRHLYGNPSELLSFPLIYKILSFCSNLNKLCTPFEKKEMGKNVRATFLRKNGMGGVEETK